MQPAWRSVVTICMVAGLPPALLPHLPLKGGTLCSLRSGFQLLPLSYLPRPLLGTLYGVS